MKRLAKAIEVGELFAFLGSDESSYLTESQIVIDGGSTLPETMSIGTNQWISVNKNLKSMILAGMSVMGISALTSSHLYSMFYPMI